MKHPPRHVDHYFPRHAYWFELLQLTHELDLIQYHAKLVEFVIWNVVSLEELPKLAWTEYFDLQSERAEEPIAIPGFKPVGLTGWVAVPIIDLLRDHDVTIKHSRHSSEADYRAVSPLISRYMKLFPSEMKAARIKRGGTKKGRVIGMRPATQETYRRICEQYDAIATEHPHLTMKEITRRIGQPRSSIYRALGGPVGS